MITQGGAALCPGLGMFKPVGLSERPYPNETGFEFRGFSPRMGQQHRSPGQSAETERREAPALGYCQTPNVALKGPNYATSLACVPA